MQTNYKLYFNKNMEDEFVISYDSMKTLEVAFEKIQDAFVMTLADMMYGNIICNDMNYNFGEINLSQRLIFILGVGYYVSELREVRFIGSRSKIVEFVFGDLEIIKGISFDNIGNYKLLIEILKKLSYDLQITNK